MTISDLIGREFWPPDVIQKMELHVDILAKESRKIVTWGVIGAVVVYFLLPKGQQEEFLKWLEDSPEMTGLYVGQPTKAIGKWIELHMTAEARTL